MTVLTDEDVELIIKCEAEKWRLLNERRVLLEKAKKNYREAMLLNRPALAEKFGVDHSTITKALNDRKRKTLATDTNPVA